MRVLVCGWLGSSNLGDELVFRGVQRLLGDRADITAVSVDPAATARSHGVAAIDHRRLDEVARAARRADLVVFGGGGLVQDETSPFNLPYHLSRTWQARMAGTPWVGLGLGVGPLDTRLGRVLARSLATAAAITVRDVRSRTLLASLGIPAFLGADTAFHLAANGPIEGPPILSVAAGGLPERRPEPEVDVSDGHIAVSLRPWTTGSSRLPVGWHRGEPETPDWFVPTLASALDRVQIRTGADIELVALQTDRDHALHQQVAAVMRHSPRLVVPTVDEVIWTLGRARLVVAMRYHAGIAATLTGRPSLLIGYSPKVTSLAQDLGRGAAHLPFERAALAGLDEQVTELATRADAAGAVRAGLATLQRLAQVNDEVVRRALP